MRCDQFAGLPDDAVKFLNENTKPPIICPTCNCVRPVQIDVVGHYAGMFGDNYDLHRHKLNDGGYADEYVQAAPWSSGPVFFIGLHVYDKHGVLRHSFLWSEDEICNA
jgi:hypothetical protein